METGNKAAEQNNPPEQQVQQNTPVQNVQQGSPMQQAAMFSTVTVNPESVVENYQEIKAALTGAAFSWVLPDLNPRAAATEPAILLDRKNKTA